MIPALISVAVVALFCVLLIKAVNLFISSSTRIAHKTNISTYTLSFLLISLATSLPEVMIGITSAIEKKPILSYTNVLGSNIVLYTLIAAMPVLFFKNLDTRSVIKSRDIYLGVFFSFITVFIAFDGNISRFEGLLLLILYLFYAVIFMERSSTWKKLSQEFEHVHLWKEAAIFFVTLIFIIGAGNVIVSGILNLSTLLSIKLGVLGLTVTALGTSLPEITYSIELAKQNKHKEILGNILGSVVANSTVVLGITALIEPISPTSQFETSAYAFTIISALAFTFYAKSGRSISKIEALILLAIYIMFVLTEYL